MPSFDIVCEVDLHEVANAVDQANRELGQRYDFRGVKASYELKDADIILKAEVDFQLNQMRDILRQKMAKRGVDMRALDPQTPTVQLGSAQQNVKLQQGIATDKAKDLIKRIKSSKIKVQTAIQGDQVRVTGKKRDDLQEVIALMRESDVDLPLQYVNFRD